MEEGGNTCAIRTTATKIYLGALAITLYTIIVFLLFLSVLKLIANELSPRQVKMIVIFCTFKTLTDTWVLNIVHHT